MFQSRWRRVLALLGCQGDGRDAGGSLNVGTRQARGDDFAHHDLIRRGKAEILKPSVLGQLLRAEGFQAFEVVALGLAAASGAAGGIHHQLTPGDSCCTLCAHRDGGVAAYHDHHILIIGRALGVGQVGKVAVLGRIAGVPVQQRAVQLEQQLFLCRVEPEPEADVQLLTYLLSHIQQTAGCGLAGVGVGDLGQVAELDAGPRLHGRDQLAERCLCRKILQGLEAAALVEDVGCVAGRDHKAVVGGLGGAYPHEVLAAYQP